MDNRVTYVLDTSAVLSEPACLFGFGAYGYELAIHAAARHVARGEES